MSSAAITAVTASGTNEFHGDGFYDYTDADWREDDRRRWRRARHKRRTQAGAVRPHAGRPDRQGPHALLLRLRGQEQRGAETLTLGGGVLPNAGIGHLASQAGPTTAPFDEDLIFGKLDWQLAPDHYLARSSTARRRSSPTSAGRTPSLRAPTRRTTRPLRPEAPVDHGALDQRGAPRLRGHLLEPARDSIGNGASSRPAALDHHQHRRRPRLPGQGPEGLVASRTTSPYDFNWNGTARRQGGREGEVGHESTRCEQQPVQPAVPLRRQRTASRAVSRGVRRAARERRTAPRAPRTRSSASTSRTTGR